MAEELVEVAVAGAEQECVHLVAAEDHALTQAEFPGAELIWATIGFVVLVSVVLHGVAATPVMRHLDRANERTDRTHAAAKNA